MIENFLATLTFMQAGRARKTLETLVRVNGVQYWTRDCLIRDRVANGAKVVTRRNGEVVLMNPDDSWLDEKNATKTGIKYAEYLIKNRIAVLQK